MISEMVKALGGPNSVAKWLRENTGQHMTEGAVTAWYQQGRDSVPWKWRGAVKALAEERKVTLKPEWQEALRVTPTVAPEKRCA